MSKLALFGGPKAVTLPYHNPWPVIGEDEIAAVVALMREGKISIGDGSGPIGEFEAEFAAFTGARYALMTNNGTSALHSGLYGVGVRPGDEVLVPDYTWHATAGAVIACNAIPIFCECEPSTLNLDVDDAARRITPRTRAIMVVHMWGNVADMDRVMALARGHGLKVVEDCSHAHGATWRGKHVGRWGDVGCFSLQGSKVTVAGEGGALITEDPAVYDRALLLGQFGRVGKHANDERLRKYTTGLGFKYRPHPLGAAIALGQLKQLNAFNAGRKANFDYLTAGLADIACIESTRSPQQAVRGGYYGTRLLYRPDKLLGISRETLLKALRAEGVECDVERYELLHLTPFYSERCQAYEGYNPPGAPTKPLKAGDLPISEAFHARLIGLPVFTEPAFELLDQYIEAFHKVTSSENIEDLKEADLNEHATNPS